MATDFFDQQDTARRQTGRLIALFVLAVAAIVAAVYGVVTAVAVSGGGRSLEAPGRGVFDPARFALVSTCVLLVITTGSLYKLAVLRDGGDAIARMLGGRLIDPASASFEERRLLNVVEEMALASGTPVPPVYVLDNETCINAFAAGFTPGDAVVAVSRGCLEYLTRDEQQGVIGHEFSHILNGDMRLNLRLIGLVHGILVVALLGQLIFRLVLEGSSRSRSNSKEGGGVAVALLVIGGAVFLIGSIGVFFGRIIKCAISRQREFLADASSVQFTRNPDGIVGALKKIGGVASGSRIRNHNAEQACHMFFGQGVFSLSRLLATHPPLEERIRRLDPSFEGAFPEVVPELAGSEEQEERRAGVSRLGSERPSPVRPALAPLTPAAALASVGTPTQEHVDYAASLIEELPPELADAAREPFSARAVVFALLLDGNDSARRMQLGNLAARTEPGTADVVYRLAPVIDALPKDARIPLVDLTFPALRRLSLEQYRRFRDVVDNLIKADRRVSLYEYTLERMLFRHLDMTFFRQKPPGVRYLELTGLFGDCTVLLSTLARLGQQDEPAVVGAFTIGMARLQENHPGEMAARLLPPDRCTLGDIERALKRLAHASPAIKRRVLSACAACVATDGVVNLGEGELLRAIADSLDCPMPPLLGRPGT
jgi:Zn-dependent protease with chaperone function